MDKCKRFVSWLWANCDKARDPVEQRKWVNNVTPFRGPTWDRDFPTMMAGPTKTRNEAFMDELRRLEEDDKAKRATEVQ